MLKSADKWYGVTYKEDKPAVERAVRDMVASGAVPAAALGRANGARQFTVTITARHGKSRALLF